ncbi:hypothetical protein MCERE10_02719 [Burkholderiaceae bacterium]
MAFGLLGMFVKCGRVTVFQGRANKSLAGRDSRPALALKIKTPSRYLAISLSRYLAATILVKSVGVLWWWQPDLNQYSFI